MVYLVYVRRKSVRTDEYELGRVPPAGDGEEQVPAGAGRRELAQDAYELDLDQSQQYDRSVAETSMDQALAVAAHNRGIPPPDPRAASAAKADDGDEQYIEVAGALEGYVADLAQTQSNHTGRPIRIDMPQNETPVLHLTIPKVEPELEWTPGYYHNPDSQRFSGASDRSSMLSASNLSRNSSGSQFTGFRAGEGMSPGNSPGANTHSKEFSSA